MSENQWKSREAMLLPEQNSRRFGDIMGMWMDFSHMDEEYLAREAPYANTANTFLSIWILVIFGALISMISIQFFGLPGQLPTSGMMTLSLFSWMSGRIAGFFIFNGMIFGLARLLGGHGPFAKQLYLQTLFQVPLGILGTLATLAPGLGLVALVVIAVYTVRLNMRVLKVAHGLSDKRAWVASLVPALAIGLFVVLGGAVLTLALAGLKASGAAL